jgi:hypothetical protein
MGRGILLWLLGVPIPVIVILSYCWFFIIEKASRARAIGSPEIWTEG